MIEALYIAGSGVRTQQEYLEIISNNVANMNTPAYKRVRPNFIELAAPSGSSSASNANLMGTKLNGVQHTFEQGDLKQTGRKLDIAITGKGFLEVNTSSGETAYTKLGQLTLDSQGKIQTNTGQTLESDIVIPIEAKDIVIKEDGEVLAILPGEIKPVLLGEIELAYFASETSLESIGDSLFIPTNESGDAFYAKPGEEGTGKLQQGFLEVSNVSMVAEMVELLSAQRAYQLNARIIQAADQIMETTNNLTRG